MKIHAIVGEVCRYRVDSETHPNQSYVVDLLAGDGGECGCPSWTCNHRAHRNESGKAYRCKHLIAVREHFLDDVLDSLKMRELEK